MSENAGHYYGDSLEEIYARELRTQQASPNHENDQPENRTHIHRCFESQYNQEGTEIETVTYKDRYGRKVTEIGTRNRRDELDGTFCLKMEPEEYWYKGKFIQGIFIEGDCREQLYGKTVYEGKYKNGKRHGDGRLIKFRLHLGTFS